MNIYEALRQSHETQRELYKQLTTCPVEARSALLSELSIELLAHATAEERYFLVPILELDNGIDIARHAIAEHLVLDELIEKLDKLETSEPSWLPTMMMLSAEIEHHLTEEERSFFQQSGKLLDAEQKERFANDYLNEFERLKKKFAKEN